MHIFIRAQGTRHYLLHNNEQRTESSDFAMKEMATNISSSTVVDQSYDKGFTNAVVATLSIVAIFGVLGNVLVVAVICRAKKLRSVMNRFVLHLAVSDLIVCTFGIPLFLAINFKKLLPDRGTEAEIQTMCKLGRFVQYLAPLASLTLLITIGMNRHRAIVHPLNIMTYRQANKLIAAAWIFALIMTAPSLYLTQLQTIFDKVSNSSYLYCATIQTDVLSGLIYTFALSLLGYVIPLVILILLYTKIYLTVWRRPKNNIAQLPATRLARTKKKVLKMLITVILVFVITWLPLFIYVGIIQPLLRKSDARDHVRLVTYSLGLSQSSLNPIIYGFYNKNFRDGCKEVFKLSFRVVRAPAEMLQRSIKERSAGMAAYSPKKEENMANLNRQRRAKYRSTSDEVKPVERDNESLEDENESFQHNISLKRSGGIRLKEACSENGKICDSPLMGCKGLKKQKLVTSKSDGYLKLSDSEATFRTRSNTAETTKRFRQDKGDVVAKSHNTTTSGGFALFGGEDGNICPAQEHDDSYLQLSIQNVNTNLHENGDSSQPDAKTGGLNEILSKNSSNSQPEQQIQRIRSIRFAEDYDKTWV